MRNTMNPAKIPPVTMKDVAQHMGISPAAVAQALSGKGRLSSDQRKKILQQAESMGYRRDNIATSLAMRRWQPDNQVSHQRNIALLTHMREELKPVGKFIGDKIMRLCKEAGHGFTHMDLSAYARASTWKNLLKSRGVEGVIVGLGFNEALLKDPFWKKFTVVKCGALDGGEATHCVYDDPYARIHYAVDLLESRDYTRIGFVLTHHIPFNADDLKRIGALYTLKFSKPRLTLVKPFMFPFAKYIVEIQQKDASAPDSDEVLREKYLKILTPALLQWLEQEKPQVVVGMNEDVYQALIQSGLKIPDEVASLTLNTATHGKIGEIHPTGYRRNFEKMATMSVRLLEQLMQYPFMAANGPIHVIAPSELVEGHTLRKE